MNGRRALRAALLAGVFLLLLPALAGAQGCVMCVTSLGDTQDGLTLGIFRSVVFLVSMPGVVILSVGGWLYYKLNHAPAGASLVGAAAGQEPSASVVEFRRRLT